MGSQARIIRTKGLFKFTQKSHETICCEIPQLNEKKAISNILWEDDRFPENLKVSQKGGTPKSSI